MVLEPNRLPLPRTPQSHVDIPILKNVTFQQQNCTSQATQGSPLIHPIANYTPLLPLPLHLRRSCGIYCYCSLVDDKPRLWYPNHRDYVELMLQV